MDEHDCTHTEELGYRYRGLQLVNIPANLLRMRFLQKLCLTNAGITNIPDDISRLTNLTELILDCNPLTNISREIHKLSKLERLSLAGNGLLTVPEEIFGIRRLKTLCLNNNRIKIIPPGLCGMKTLWTLNMSDNQIETIPDELCELKHLTWLFLSRNKIRTVPTFLLQKLRLEKLDLALNDIKQLVVRTPHPITTRWLHLDQNPIELISPEIIVMGGATPANIIRRGQNVGRLRNIISWRQGCIKIILYRRDTYVGAIPKDIKRLIIDYLTIEPVYTSMHYSVR